MHKSWQADADLGTFDGRTDARKRQPRREHLERYSSVYRKCYEKAYDAETPRRSVNALLAPKVTFQSPEESEVWRTAFCGAIVRLGLVDAIATSDASVKAYRQRSIQPDDAGP